ncbi:hypothetical protein [Streptomyces sp. CdTB01]|uniref:deazapurine DNA modification protein DpdA family protein n=1 Tax=Streptomyces sp. CdTB01 TaxID=1725411 RepID=UPI00073A76E5|nr:hypothetical protein [Streptomyces sp. CdTB01]ALV39155.1 hypothetical protein AS200_44370 [Streptomyces sp. CdTB01]
MCVSRSTLTERATLPRAADAWVCDSGAFSELGDHDGWTVSAYAYVRELRRYRDEIGLLVWAGYALVDGVRRKLGVPPGRGAATGKR